jgi:hypothetical protein
MVAARAEATRHRDVTIPKGLKTAGNFPAARFYEPFGDLAWNLSRPGEFVHQSRIFSSGRVSEVDPMGAKYPLSVHRRIEQQWAERLRSLQQIRNPAVTATEPTLQGRIPSRHVESGSGKVSNGSNTARSTPTT